MTGICTKLQYQLQCCKSQVFIIHGCVTIPLSRHIRDWLTENGYNVRNDLSSLDYRGASPDRTIDELARILNASLTVTTTRSLFQSTNTQASPCVIMDEFETCLWNLQYANVWRLRDLLDSHCKRNSGVPVIILCNTGGGNSEFGTIASKMESLLASKHISHAYADTRLLSTGHQALDNAISTVLGGGGSGGTGQDDPRPVLQQIIDASDIMLAYCRLYKESEKYDPCHNHIDIGGKMLCNTILSNYWNVAKANDDIGAISRIADEMVLCDTFRQTMLYSGRSSLHEWAQADMCNIHTSGYVTKCTLELQPYYSATPGVKRKHRRIDAFLPEVMRTKKQPKPRRTDNDYAGMKFPMFFKTFVKVRDLGSV